MWKGRAAMQESLAKTITNYGGSTLKLTRTSLYIVSPEVVVTDGTWEISGGKPEGAPTSGFYTFILAKEGDAWKAESLRIKVPPAK
jgi:ketosteroid isomerase-like protein